jgi:hypothetical protein
MLRSVFRVRSPLFARPAEVALVIALGVFGLTSSTSAGASPPKASAPKIPTVSVVLDVTPNPAPHGQVIQFEWAANGMNPPVSCHDNHNPSWIGTGPGNGSGVVYKTAGVDFTQDFVWRVDCENEIVSAFGTELVDYQPPQPPPPPPPPPPPDCQQGGSLYRFTSPNADFKSFGYRQVHLHDYRPGVALSPNNFTQITWRVYNNFQPNAGIEFFFVHNHLGGNVLDWKTTSASGAVTTGSYGVVPADIRIRVDRILSTWHAVVNYNSTDYFVTEVFPSDSSRATLQLSGSTDVETPGPCNSVDMRFDGGAPGSGSYTFDEGFPPCGRRYVWDFPVPLNCSKDVQIRFFYG